jgi:hypothetical protein
MISELAGQKLKVRKCCYCKSKYYLTLRNSDQVRMETIFYMDVVIRLSPGVDTIRTALMNQFDEL